MTETIGRKPLTEMEKKQRNDEGYKTYQKNISARNVNEPDTTKHIKALPKTEWIKSKPSGESPSDKFTRIAKDRMTVTLNKMDKLINLSSGQYKATDEQVKKMVDTLREKVTEIETSFGKVKVSEKQDFNF